MIKPRQVSRLWLSALLRLAYSQIHLANKNRVFAGQLRKLEGNLYRCKAPSPDQITVEHNSYSDQWQLFCSLAIYPPTWTRREFAYLGRIDNSDLQMHRTQLLTLPIELERKSFQLSSPYRQTHWQLQTCLALVPKSKPTLSISHFL